MSQKKKNRFYENMCNKFKIHTHTQFLCSKIKYISSSSLLILFNKDVYETYCIDKKKKIDILKNLFYEERIDVNIIIWHIMFAFIGLHCFRDTNRFFQANS